MFWVPTKCFGCEIKKIIFNYPFLSGGLNCYRSFRSEIGLHCMNVLSVLINNKKLIWWWIWPWNGLTKYHKITRCTNNQSCVGRFRGLTVESDHGCTSRIFLDNARNNVTQTLYNVTLMSQKPCKHNNKCDCSKANDLNEVYVVFFQYNITIAIFYCKKT